MACKVLELIKRIDQNKEIKQRKGGTNVNLACFVQPRTNYAEDLLVCDKNVLLFLFAKEKLLGWLELIH